MSDRSHLYRTLTGLPKTAQNLVIGPAMHKAAEIIAAEIRRQAPVETGRLRDSVKVIDGRNNDGSPTVAIEVSGGHDDEGTDREHIVRFIEFGWVGHDPNPFIRRSFAAKKAEAIEQMKRDIGDGIEKVGSHL